MEDWDPAQPLPEQLADAFAVLYDRFERERFFAMAASALWDESVPDDPLVQDLVDRVRTSDWYTPPKLGEVIAGAADRRSLAYAVYACLYAIDRGVERHHPNPSRSAQGMAGGTRLRDQYDLTGRFNTRNTGGYVLAKWRSTLRGTHFSDHFHWWVRANVDEQHVHVLVGRRSGLLVPPRVAVVPFLYELEDPKLHPSGDTRLSSVTVGRKRYFRVEHLVDGPARLEERVRAAVRAVRAAGVNVAVFPELVLNEPLLRVLQGALRSPIPEEDDPLQWVIAGTLGPRVHAGDPFEHSNAAYVLDGVGRVVRAPLAAGGRTTWIQRKRHRYTLTLNEQRDFYGIDHLFDPPEGLDEAIGIEQRQFVFDSPIGRYAIAICEDWGQEEGTMADLRKLGCSVIFAIVMDGPVASSRWAPTRARNFAEQTGAAAVIANSLLLPNLPKVRRDTLSRAKADAAAGRRKPCDDEQQPVGVLVWPQPEGTPPRPAVVLCAPLDPAPGMDGALISGHESVW